MRQQSFFQQIILNTIVFVLFLLPKMSCCSAMNSCDNEEMVASELMQPFDLKAIMKAIIDDACQRNFLNQLPHGFIACYNALEQGDKMINGNDLTEALSVVFAVIMPEMMERTIKLVPL